MFGGMQAAIGDNNQQIAGYQEAPDEPTQAEVVELLKQIEQIVQSAQLPEGVQEKITKYIETAKLEAAEDEPDKELVSRSLERFTKHLEEVDKSLESGQQILKKVFPLLTKMAGWLGETAKWLWVVLP